jgi:N4-(beta-N-acetylglucosaminyl)-L-asparaginase
MQRRSFLQTATLGTVGLAACTSAKESATDATSTSAPLKKPVVLSTWDNRAANAKAYEILLQGKRALDAIEQGIHVTEADPNDHSVGYGGFPDRDGFVTLDACVMDEFSNIGAVAAIENIMHPISIARLVMEKTPHWMLVGEGALDFALSEGYEKVNLLTPEAEAEWKKWLAENGYKGKAANPHTPNTPPNGHTPAPNHDTIGMVAMDMEGNLSGGCSTSGAAWKMRGRVGDSPIIGAGLYVDNEVGAVTATGQGELVVRAAGSAMIVEYMRLGKTPEMACKMAIERIVKLYPDHKGLQVGYLALSKEGEMGGYALRPNFSISVQDADGARLVPVKHLLEW